MLQLTRWDDDAKLAEMVKNVPAGESVSNRLWGALGKVGLTPWTLAERIVGTFRDEKKSLPMQVLKNINKFIESGLAPNVENYLSTDLKLRLLRANPDLHAANDAALRLEHEVATRVDLVGLATTGATPQRIPNQIHFIWLGKLIKEPAVANILKWAELAKEERWRVTVWTDTDSEWSPAVRGRLKEAGVDLRFDVDRQVDKRFKSPDPKVSGGAPGAVKSPYYSARDHNYAGASDLIRLSAWQKFGGIYSDVDIGPGEIELSRVPFATALDLPLFGPGLRDKISVNKVLQRDPGNPVTFVDIAEAARVQGQKGEFNNSFIVAQRQNVFLDPIINSVAQKVGQIDPDDWPHLGEGVAHVSGPSMIRQSLSRVVAISEGLTKHDADKFVEKVVCDWPLEWITGESENQAWLSKSK